MTGHPKYKYNDLVVFTFRDKEYRGYIKIIDPYGTFEQEEEPSYDIECERDGKKCLYKHVRESMILRKTVHTVLCYIEQDGKYLMLLRNKKHEEMNEGKWLGVGGHVHAGEEPDHALLREVKEETGLTLDAFFPRAILYFINDDYNEVINLYTANSFHGELTSCDEGTLSWIPKDEILNLNLWEGDRAFLKEMMESDSYFEMKLYYKNNEFIRSERL